MAYRRDNNPSEVEMYIIKLYINGYSQRDIAKILNIDRSKVYRTLKKYNGNNPVI